MGSLVFAARPVRMLVCGGRDFIDRQYLTDVLEVTVAVFNPENLVLIHGGARGADLLAAAWAQERGIAVERYDADWDAHGKAAGPIRNQRMLDEGKPDIVVALPGGAGTADMVARARKAGIPVAEPRR